MTYTARVTSLTSRQGGRTMYFTVEWSESRDAWVGLCSDYPALVHPAATPTLALLGIRELVSQSAQEIRDAA